MKRWLVALVVAVSLVALPILGVAESYRDFGQDTNGNQWYVAHTGTEVSKNGKVYEVFTAEIFLTEAGRRALELHDNIYAVKVDYYVVCNELVYTVGKMTTFGYDKKPIDSGSWDEWTWQPIQKGTMMDLIARQYCGTKV
jgi:hypothetical protein